MLLITKVEVYKVDGPIVHLNAFGSERAARFFDGAGDIIEPTPLQITQETIIGETYQVGPNPQNRVVLGMTEEVKKTLGLPLDSIDNAYARLMATNVRAMSLRRAINTASFGARLRYLFNPKKGLTNE